jgi:RHS repeat-associated protein
LSVEWLIPGKSAIRPLWYANGNLTKKDDGTNVHWYKYDVRNLMTDYDGPGRTNDTTYRYDAFGRRITKNVNGTKTAYVHDGLNTVAEYNGSNQLQRTYVTPGLDQNLSLTASGSTYYYLSDALGSIRQVLDADQATQNSYDYEAFGSVYGSSTENVSQPFRFTGREWDPESTLYYYRARNYAANLGRFLARDPRFGQMGTEHLAYLRSVLLYVYGYAANTPALLTDPRGMEEGPPGVPLPEGDYASLAPLYQKLLEAWRPVDKCYGELAPIVVEAILLKVRMDQALQLLEMRFWGYEGGMVGGLGAAALEGSYASSLIFFGLHALTGEDRLRAYVRARDEVWDEFMPAIVKKGLEAAAKGLECMIRHWRYLPAEEEYMQAKRRIDTILDEQKGREAEARARDTAIEDEQRARQQHYLEWTRHAIECNSAQECAATQHDWGPAPQPH